MLCKIPVRHPEELAPIFIGVLGDGVDGGVVCPQPELLHLILVLHSRCPRPLVLGAGVHAAPPLGEHRVEHHSALGSPGDILGIIQTPDSTYLCKHTSSMLIFSTFNLPVTFQTISLQLNSIFFGNYFKQCKNKLL